MWGRSGGPVEGEFSVEEVAALAAEQGLVLASIIGHAALPDGCNNPANHSPDRGRVARPPSLWRRSTGCRA